MNDQWMKSYLAFLDLDEVTAAGFSICSPQNLNLGSMFLGIIFVFLQLAAYGEGIPEGP